MRGDLGQVVRFKNWAEPLTRRDSECWIFLLLLIDFSCSGQQFEGSKAAFKVPVITLEGLLLQTANMIISFILRTQKKSYNSQRCNSTNIWGISDGWIIAIYQFDCFHNFKWSSKHRFLKIFLWVRNVTKTPLKGKCSDLWHQQSAIASLWPGAATGASKKTSL